VNNELHAAGFIKEALQHNGVLGRQTAKCCGAGGKIFDELLGGG
jgi:hypothetical protein